MAVPVGTAIFVPLGWGADVKMPMDLKPEDQVNVEITSCQPYGCFVKILDHQLDGLIKIPHMLDEERVVEEDMPKPGTQMAAKVLAISADMPPRVSLSIKPSATGIKWHETKS